MKYFLLFLMIVCSGAFSHELTDDEIAEYIVNNHEQLNPRPGYGAFCFLYNSSEWTDDVLAKFLEEGEFYCYRQGATVHLIKTIEGECTSFEKITYIAENSEPHTGHYHYALKHNLRHTHQVHEHDYTQKIPEDAQIRKDTLQLYSHIFEEDLDNKIRELSAQAGGPEYIDLTLLKPRKTFTKPHRVQLMREVNESKENIEMPELLKVIESLEQKVVDRTLSYFAIDPTIVDYFSYDECSNYLGVEAYERIKQEWRQPQDRWWWNKNIKPLLEDMVMIGDLYHGDYVPY